MNDQMIQSLKVIGMQDWEIIQRVRKEGRILELPPLGAPASDREIIALMQMRGIRVEMSESPSQDEKELQLVNLGATKWVSCGLQQIEMGHKFAAALLVSNVTKDLIENVKRPWPAFVIVVPNDLIFISNSRDNNKPVSISKILVFEVENKFGDWAYVAWGTTEAPMLWRFGVSTEFLLPETLDENRWGNAFIASEIALTDLDERNAALIGRLIVTTCVAMTMPDMVHPRNPKTHEAWKKAKGNVLNLSKSKEPQHQVYNLGKPIAVDFRDRVKAYSRGDTTGKQLELRRMIIGHFKQQAYGKVWKDRKTLWIKPYWRGPEEAAISVSPHVIKEDQ